MKNVADAGSALAPGLRIGYMVSVENVELAAMDSRGLWTGEDESIVVDE